MENKIWLSIVVLFAVVVVLAIVLSVQSMQMQAQKSHTTIDEKRNDFILQKQQIIGEMISGGNYKCCLAKPCTYCIEKTPGHGEGASCTCLKDVMEGKHPCGECMGEIMEGHGNPYISEYFARAIADEMGEEHIDELRQMMYEKYNVSIEKQA